MGQAMNYGAMGYGGFSPKQWGRMRGEDANRVRSAFEAGFMVRSGQACGAKMRIFLSYLVMKGCE
jgi:hypothetical protein